MTVEKYYNEWQLEDLDLNSDIEICQFTKSELLHFANEYYKKQLTLPNVVKPWCDCGTQKRGDRTNCKQCGRSY